MLNGRCPVSPGFDVHFDAYAKQHLLIVDHTNRGFGGHETIPDDMKHDGTALWAQYFKSAASANSATPASNRGYFTAFGK